MIRLTTLFKTPKPKSFEFKPRYYDPGLESVRHSEKSEDGGLSEVDAIKRRMRRQFEGRHNRGPRPGRTAGNLRIALIVAVLTILTIIILK